VVDGFSLDLSNKTNLDTQRFKACFSLLRKIEVVPRLAKAVLYYLLTNYPTPLFLSLNKSLFSLVFVSRHNGAIVSN